jgi:hypothetical protein
MFLFLFWFIFGLVLFINSTSSFFLILFFRRAKIKFKGNIEWIVIEFTFSGILKIHSRADIQGALGM